MDTLPSPTTSTGGLGTDAATSGTAAWRTLLAWTAGAVAVSDLIFMGLIAAVIPPLAVGAVLTLVGLALLRRAPRSGVYVLGVTSVLLLVVGAPFIVEHLAHPSSGIDFAHSAIAIVGRLVALVATVRSLRRGTVAGARRTGVVSVGLAGVILLVAAVATVATSGDEVQVGDVVAVIADHAFPDATEVASGGTVFVDNQEPFRHTYTVEGTDIDVVTPASQGVRVAIDLPSGTYEVICAVPGHEAMRGVLEVR